MGEKPVTAEDIAIWFREAIAAGHYVNLADWIRLRSLDPAVQAKIDALDSEEASKVYEALGWVERDFETTGTVSQEAIEAFAKTARRMAEFMPILFPSDLKMAGEKFMANPTPKKPKK
jgi:hypothetical protein